MEIIPVNESGTLLLSSQLEEWSLMKELGVDTVIDTDGTIDHNAPDAPDTIIYIHFPVSDSELPEEGTLHALGRLVAEMTGRGHKVLIHCFLGLNRSNLLAAVALTYMGMDGRQAVDHIQKVRPGALDIELFTGYLSKLPANDFSDDPQPPK